MPETDSTNPDGVFMPSFNGTLQEREYIFDSLNVFYDDCWLTDVLYRVKSGKEATVYCCEAHPSTGLGLLAAKVFRPHKFRAMRNDWVYRQGRNVLGGDGKTVLDKRTLRALKKKSRYGRQVGTTSWCQHEYKALCDFHEAGANVPRPLAQSGNTILMEFVGDAVGAAPELCSVSLEASEAQALFDRLIHNVELFLSRGLIHADLSAYNVLYWKGDVKIIDLPQVSDAYTNPDALFLLDRDVDRLCRYFAKYGVQAEPSALSEDLWKRFLRGEL
jgi:RIO kinase 1